MNERSEVETSILREQVVIGVSNVKNNGTAVFQQKPSINHEALPFPFVSARSARKSRRFHFWASSRGLVGGVPLLLPVPRSG